MTRKNGDYRTNWNFKLDARLLLQCKKPTCDEKDIALLIDSIYRKQSNGVVCLVARCATTRLNCYKLSGAFVALYCVKSLLKASCDTLNMGSKRCQKCQHYHRIQHLSTYGEELEKRISASNRPFERRLTYFTENEWKTILKTVLTQCKT